MVSLAQSTIAFIPPSLLQRSHNNNNNKNNGIVSSLKMSDESPSDTSGDPFYDDDDNADDVLTVDSQDYEPTDAEALVTNVLDMIPTSFGSIDDTKRSEINEVLLKLEALNPTTSSLLNGVWELRYAAGYTSEGALTSPTRQIALFLYSGGYSPGLFALSLAQKLPVSLVELGDLEISISRSQPRIEAKMDVKLFGGSEDTIEVKARLDEDSGLRFTETYESASVLGQTIELPGALQY